MRRKARARDKDVGIRPVLFLWRNSLRIDTLGEEVPRIMDALVALERQRTAILAEIDGLGDFRSGSITAITGRCGKPGCRCHRAGEPGHGPNYRLTRKLNGKTTSESFASPAALRKAEREIAAFHRFRELSSDLLAVNEKICRARPVEDPLSSQEKKRPKRFSVKQAGR